MPFVFTVLQSVYWTRSEGNQVWLGILFLIVGLAKLSQKDQLIALGYGGSAMPLEGACAEGFASLRTAFVVNIVVFSVASEQPGFLKLRIYVCTSKESGRRLLIY